MVGKNGVTGNREEERGLGNTKTTLLDTSQKIKNPGTLVDCHLSEVNRMAPLPTTPTSMDKNERGELRVTNSNWERHSQL